ncbi:MAG: SAM-dependent chlorinase/fluorinase [Acidobacteriota bacterium]|nr:SAM-dependent chlorinase/fluorinase [Blastocatellia bacterium]MDW8239547.1 SAM-dependent chlorinase/fluorinase [Acidobacteriota bacterium]
MNTRPSVITLTTDFGLDDFFVGAMKGVILSINPAVHIVDITHTIRAHDVREGAFTLAQAYAEFPPGTIHVAIVDPGVGSARRPIIVLTPMHLFVGPDNGIFSFVYAQEDVRAIIHITAEHYFRKPVSRTFHGRDIFAPVAAWLSAGVAPESFGQPIHDPVRFELPQPERISATHIRGQVIHVDRFGNLLTNLTGQHLSSDVALRGATLVVNERRITRFQSHFAEAAAEEPFAVVGSTGRVEIAVYQDSAERILNASVGTTVDVYIETDHALG